jgi:hypothetical protein
MTVITTSQSVDLVFSGGGPEILVPNTLPAT